MCTKKYKINTFKKCNLIKKKKIQTQTIKITQQMKKNWFLKNLKKKNNKVTKIIKN